MLMNKLNDYLYNTEQDDINHLIVKYIKKHINDIENMTIDELANGCFVSKGKISKFCKILGYDNFIAFKDDCAKEVKRKSVVIENQKEGLELEFKEHLHKSLCVLERNLMQCDPKDISLLVRKMIEADYIFLLGTAYSNLMCKYLQYECDNFNKDVIVMDEKLHKDYVMKKKSLMIIVSVEGLELEHERRLLNKLNKYPVEKWIITTDVVNDKMIKKFDHSIIIPSRGADTKERRLLLRYMIDIIMGRYQYLSS